MQIGPRTRLAALFGDPVQHSLSPVIHNTAYRFQGVDAVYLAMRVPVESLEEAVLGLKAVGALGINLTLPHKQAVLPLLDEIRADAKAIGAVNTIAFQHAGDGVRMIGENTDVTGFLVPLSEMKESIRGGRAVVLGAGGAARAVLYACQTSLQPECVTVVARNTHRAIQMVEALYDVGGATPVEVRSFEDVGGLVADASLVVNTTPVGLYPDVHETPWPHVESFRPGQIVYDLVYNPVMTRLLRDAQARGATTLNGSEMLIAQAAAAHTLWTGLRMPVSEVRDVVIDTLDSQHG